MVILMFGKSSLLSKNKFIGKQKYFIACLFLKKCSQQKKTAFLLLSITVLLFMASFKKKCVRAKN
jgi:hypothetical protein